MHNSPFPLPAQLARLAFGEELNMKQKKKYELCKSPINTIAPYATIKFYIKYSMQPILSIKNLNIQFGNEGNIATAVKNSNIDVLPGEIVAIVGESGSGKSVTALSILQLLPSSTIINGEILFTPNNTPTVNLLKLTSKTLRAIRGSAISMIFQEPMTSLNPVFTCGQQVMEAIRLHQKVSKKVARQKTIILFDKVKLPQPSNILNRYPHELSGGQKQRVMIAMAMSCNPSLLIADEPTTALDVTVQKTILELIKELQLQYNMGVILITHDLGIVADIADKIAVMYKGEIVEQGIAKELLQHAQHPYTKALLNCRPMLHAKGNRLPVLADFISPQAKKEIINYPLPKKHNHQPTILEVKNLKVYFPLKKKNFAREKQFFKAVDDVSFIVQKGETLGLVGESGCGKTTLGRTILNLIQPTEGEILLNNKDISRLNNKSFRSIRKNLQIVFQDPYGSLNPRLTIGNAILEPLKAHSILQNNNQRKEKVIHLLEKVNLQSDHFNRYPHQFSGGQRQRICIARALALNPAFLIFDESVSALDVSVQAQILNLLNDLKAEFEFTSIFISHDLAVVRYISDRILVMNNGKIIEHGYADDIYNNPQQPYTQKLIEAIPGKNFC